MTTYDTAIVGAGICGCSTAHFLTEGGEKVVVFDREGIAAGGSGAAGAFISPKISKGGPLKALMEEAYLFSLDLYRKRFPGLVRIAPLVHLAKYDDENEKVRAFRTHTSLELLPDGAACEVPLTPETAAFEQVRLAASGLVDAAGVCRAMLENAGFLRKQIDIIKYEAGFWHLGGLRAKKVVLATGAFRPVVEMPHISLRAVWGHRVDIRTATPLPCHLHQYVSVAATDEKGFGAIGATHDVHFDPERGDVYDIEKGRRELLEKAAKTVALEKVEVLRDYTGMRSGSNDYFPMAGPVVDADATLRRFPKLAIGEKRDVSEFEYRPGLFMVNGTGGYGFVLGPLLGKRLAEHLLGGAALPSALDPTRFFVRWAKRKKGGR